MFLCAVQTMGVPRKKASDSTHPPAPVPRRAVVEASGSARLLRSAPIVRRSAAQTITIPTCAACGERRWFASRQEEVVIEVDLDETTGRFGQDEVVDADLLDMTFACRACGEDADARAEESLQEIFECEAC